MTGRGFAGVYIDIGGILTPASRIELRKESVGGGIPMQGEGQAFYSLRRIILHPNPYPALLPSYPRTSVQCTRYGEVPSSTKKERFSRCSLQRCGRRRQYYGRIEVGEDVTGAIEMSNLLVFRALSAAILERSANHGRCK